MDVVAGVLVVLGGFVIVAPWLTIVQRAIRREQRSTSFVPLLGPGLCALGFCLLGAPAWLYAIPLALDAGTIGLLVVLVTSLQSRSRSS